MAEPGAALQAHIRGLREAKAAFQALPAITRGHLNTATETTLSEIVRHAKARIQSSPSVRTRSLLNSVAFTLNKNNGRGRVGVSDGSSTISFGGTRFRIKGTLRMGSGGSASTSQGAKLIRPSRYAHLIEFGSRKQRAEPFMMPAAKSQEGPYLDRCKRAGTDVEKDIAAIGMRHL